MARPKKENTRKSLFGKKLEALNYDEKNIRLSEYFGVGLTAVSKYLNGDSTPSMIKIQEFVLNFAADHGMQMIDLNWLMNDNDRRQGPIFIGQDATAETSVLFPSEKDDTEYPVTSALDRLSAPPDSRRMKVRRRENVHWWESDIQQWEVRGTGAATAALGTAGDELGYAVDMVEPPAGLTLVEAKGDSMSPVILDGQYAMVDATREGFEVNGGIYVLVTISADGEPTVRIKRCYRIDDEYECCSIDSKNHPAFRAKISNSRVWPVIGVWFAGKGRPPRRG